MPAMAVGMVDLGHQIIPPLKILMVVAGLVVTLGLVVMAEPLVMALLPQLALVVVAAEVEQEECFVVSQAILPVVAAA